MAILQDCCGDEGAELEGKTFELICIPILNCGHEPCDQENEIAYTSG